MLTVLSALAGCPALCAFVSGDFPELEGQSEEQVRLDLSCVYCIRSSKGHVLQLQDDLLRVLRAVDWGQTHAGFRR